MTALEKAIKEYKGKGDGHHYFDDLTRRWFSSRFSRAGYVAAGGAVYFVESVLPPHSKRRYQVCRISADREEVEGIGHDGKVEPDCFRRFVNSLREAHRLARAVATGLLLLLLASAASAIDLYGPGEQGRRQQMDNIERMLEERTRPPRYGLPERLPYFGAHPPDRCHTHEVAVPGRAPVTCTTCCAQSDCVSTCF